EQRTRLIIDAIKDCAIYMLDPEGRIASWSRGAEALSGYAAQEIISRHFSVLYPPDRQQPPEGELTVAARQGWFEEECWHWRSDAQGSCDYLNQAWFDYTGRSREAELGSGWMEGIHPDDRARWSAGFDWAYGAMQPFEIEFRLRRADGEYGSMICVGRPYQDM